MNKFTLTKASKMGDPDPKYGQTYWAEGTTEDTDEHQLMFSTNKTIEKGAVITCEESVNKTSKKGAPYLLLRGVQIEMPSFQTDQGATTKAQPTAQRKSYTPRDDAAIKAQWAIGQAVAMCGHGKIEPDDIEPQAMTFFDMVNRVKEPNPVNKVQETFPGADQIEIPGDN